MMVKSTKNSKAISVFFLPKKKPLFVNFPSGGKRKNKKIEKDRAFAEKVLRWVSTLQAVLSHPYKWKKKLCEDIFRFCATFTNHRISISSVGASDVFTFTLHCKKLFKDGMLRKRKEAERQKLPFQLRVAALAIAEEENDEDNKDAESKLADENGL